MPTPTPADYLVIVTATPGPEVRATPTPMTGTTYRVREGDTISGIAARFDVTEAALLAANGLADPNLVEVGQRLTIPPPER